MSFGWVSYYINSWKLRALYGPCVLVEKNVGIALLARSNFVIIHGYSGFLNSRFFSYVLKVDGVSIYFESKEEVCSSDLFCEKFIINTNLIEF